MLRFVAHLHLTASMSQYHWKHFYSFLTFPWIYSSLKSQYLSLRVFLNFDHLRVKELSLLANKFFVLKPARFLWRNCFSFSKHFQIYLFQIQYLLFLSLYSKISFFHIPIGAGYSKDRNHFFLLNAIFLSVIANIFLKSC